jgi:FAD/FMN-containing dehydrogenase
MAHTTLHESLLFALDGKGANVTLPQDAAHVPVFNKDIPIVPAAIVRPETVQQVAAVVKSATERGLKVQAKSGGHSYANHGTYHLMFLIG